MTDLIDKPASNHEPRLYRDRLSVIESGQQTWPMVERRMAPRRREESARIDDRRVTELPKQPNLKLVVPETDGRVDGRRRPHDRHIRRYRTTAVALDLVAASVGALVAQIGRFGIAPSDRALAYWWGSLALPVLWVLAVLISRAYENRFLASSAEEYRRVINAAVGLIAGIAVVSYLMKTEFARGYVVLALPCCMVISLLGSLHRAPPAASRSQAGQVPSGCLGRRPRMGRARPGR